MVRDVITHLLFGRDVAYNATGMTDVDAGEIIVIGKGGAKLSAAQITNLGDDEPFYIVEGKLATNDNHIISPRLTKADIVAHRGTSYAAPVEQVSYVGSNGTQGSINLANSTEYVLKVSFIYDKDIYSKRHNVKTFSYTSDATATQAEIANGLIAVMNADADFAAQAVAALTTQGGNNGISITGLAQSVSNYDNPIQVQFKVAIGDGFDNSTQIDEGGYVYVSGAAGTTSGAASVSPTPGVGTYAKMKAMEHNNIGFTTGQTNHRLFPIIEADARVSATGTYDVYVIDYKNSHESGDIGLPAKRTTSGQIIIANDISTTVNGTTTALEALFLAITGTAVNL